jgi:hypothetical protein
MAKRFIDTGFYKSPFVRGLEGPCKALYSFIICDCSGAGIWSKDLEIAGLYIGFKISEAQWSVFEKTGRAIPIGGDRFFFPDFIEHQYPSGLQDNNRAHIGFISELKKFNLIDGANKPLTRSLQGPMVMVKDMVTVTEEVTVKETGLQKSQTAISKMKPSEPELFEYFTELGHADQAAVFHDYYSSNGWRVGKNAMKDWRATARNWCRRIAPQTTDDASRKINRTQTVGEVTQSMAQAAAMIEAKRNQIT